MFMIWQWALVTLIFTFGNGSLPRNRPPPLSIKDEELLRSIIRNMTVKEKARQLTTVEGNRFILRGQYDLSSSEKTLGDLGAGRLHDVYCNDASICNQIQKAVVASSRFQIGAIFGEECTHGYQRDGHTIFPAPLSSGATFNVNLLRDIGSAIAAEARSSGTHECWSPILGLAREPRWGRTNELFSEDTFHAKALGSYMVDGMQHQGELDNELAVSALIKHYAMYSIPDNGLNTAPASIGKRLCLTDFLPVFEAAVAAGAQGVMSSYNSVDGEPVSSSHYFLTDVLRKQYGFDGHIIADFGAIYRLASRDFHSVAEDNTDAVKMFLQAGGNSQGPNDPDGDFEKHIDTLIVDSKLSNQILDNRVLDILRVKFRLGLIGFGGRPVRYTDISLLPKVTNSLPFKELALKAARESMVLLQNEKRTLPFSNITSLAIIGPNADSPQFGDYTGTTTNRGGNANNINCIGVLEAFKNVLNVPISYVVGESITGSGGSCGETSDYFQPILSHHFKTLVGHYFGNIDLSGVAIMVRSDAAQMFHWFGWGPDPLVLPTSQFSARWNGVLQSDTTASGEYTGFRLRIANQAGIRLWLNGNLVLDEWNNHNDSFFVPFNFTTTEVISVDIEFYNSGENGYLEFFWSQLGDGSLKDAVQAVKFSSHAILVVGENPSTENEGLDRSGLGLPGNQMRLVKAVTAAAKESHVELVVVLVHGKPLAEPWIKENIDAVLETFLAGQAQGVAISDVILGNYNPAGRLPISFPVSSETLPIYYSHHMSARKTSTCDLSSKAL